MQKKIYFFFFLLSLGQSCDVLNSNNSQSTNTNQNKTKTNNSPSNAINQIKNISAKYEVLMGEDSLTIWVKIDAERLYEEENVNAFINDFKLNYDLAKDYASYNYPELLVNNASISLNQQNVIKHQKNFYVFFNIPRRNIVNAVLRIKILDTRYNKSLSEFLYLEYINSKIRQEFSIFTKVGKVPIFRRYLAKNDTIRLQNVDGKNVTFTVKHVQKEFLPAKTPFAKIDNNITNLKNLPVKRTFQVKSNDLLNFQESGLYVIQSDTSQYFALSFYVAENRFPKLANIKDLVYPLTYITTSEEIEELKNSKETKQTMDKFWLKIMSGDIQRAKRTIKTYYRRVKQANEFFTTYKEGWKTDMGMVYTIFGQPSTVRRSADREEWTYKGANLSNIRFNFIRKASQFSDNHYVLQRYAEYEQIWYDVLEAWRAGLIK